MSREKNSFRHESLQDTQSIRNLLQALLDGIDNGELAFSEGKDTLTLTPQGLMQVKLTAQREDAYNRVNLRFSWHEQGDTDGKQKTLKINGKSTKK
ncbi:amphi-Trp domain-containing protein [Gilvimarinus agarilyticus]|uniref:amphi-Trp domain-containing protein n=1 Tax=Gilvimarinus agarilyticus TaxID=679259 RepID=UPI000697FD63|nr:amphi-Trp domain-containing protein [Gilvimarinus agarilyticus]